MIDMIVLAVVIVWFTRTAKRLNEHPLVWSLVAAASYLIPAGLVHSTLVASLLDPVSNSTNFRVTLAGLTAARIVAGMVGCFVAGRALLRSGANNAATQTHQSRPTEDSPSD